MRYLCYHDGDWGEICTNKCPFFLDCTDSKIPFLIQTLDCSCEDVEFCNDSEMPVVIFGLNDSQPEAYINDIANCEEADDTD